jgi:hypothetical protein
MSAQIDAPPNSAAGIAAQPRRAYWLKTLHQWHWISAAVCLMGMLLFTITGFTLNHAGDIESKPRVSSKQATLDGLLVAELARQPEEAKSAPLPAPLRAWLSDQWGVNAAGKDAEWSKDEVYVSLPRPGGDAWVRIDRASGAVEYEVTDRGWISYLNDLHKGRHTGSAWRWFIDVFAAVCLVFCVTGLFILKMHAANRASTWPVVGAGLVIPLLLALLFIH